MTGWLLDTNVVSELSRQGGDARVAAWARGQPEQRMIISVITLAEYDKGIAALPANAAARPRLEAAVRALEHRFAGRVLPLSDAVVRRWGRISSAARQAGKRFPPVIDSLLAATAVEHDLTLVTRNLKDFAGTGARLFNPWR